MAVADSPLLAVIGASRAGAGGVSSSCGGDGRDGGGSDAFSVASSLVPMDSPELAEMGALMASRKHNVRVHVDEHD